MATQELTVIQRELPALVPTNVAKARLAEIRQFVKEELREGIDQDFAVIPGTGKKPSLLQPGAEKLIEKLGLSPTFPQSAVHWSYENHEAGEYMVDVLCQLVNLYTGQIQAECWGSAGRSAQEELDASNAKAREYNKPERSLSFRDKGLARNTAFKLAQKSALVGATLKAARLAVEFTQDVEDFTRPAPAKTESDPASAYYCQEHKTEWFKRGKMQRYAHPIGDTGKWCNMPEPKGGAIPTTMREIAEEDEPADIEDLGEPVTGKKPYEQMTGFEKCNAILELARMKGKTLPPLLREWNKAGTYSSPSLSGLKVEELDAIKKWLDGQ